MSKPDQEGYSLPPDVMVERGMVLEQEGAVRSAVFHVETSTERCIVYEKRDDSGGAELACTCPKHSGCEHVAAVMVHLARFSGTRGGAEPPLAPSADKGRVSWTSDDGLSATLGPAATASAQVSAAQTLYDDEKRASHLRETLRAILQALDAEGLQDGHVTLVEHVTTLEKLLDGVLATDVVRPCAELRDVILNTDDDPGRLAMVLERIHGVLGVLGDFLDGADPGQELQSSYLGRSWTFDEAQRQEDVTLLEMARSTARTPFGLRRSRAFYMDLDSGGVFVEHSHEGLDETSVPSVGPFPRCIQAGLMMIMPGIPPAPIRLLQYVILPAPGEPDLLKLKKHSLDTVSEAQDTLREAVSMARAPYPAFVAFGPAHVRVRGDRADLVDGEGAMLALAHRIDPPACEALALISRRTRIHCVMGLMVWTGHEIALNPLSLLLENAQGLSLLRLR